MKTFRSALAALTLAVSCSAAAAQQAESYSVKPSDVAIPDGVAPGRYLRTIRPFGNWTLICDENLERKQRICNVSQSIVDKRGATSFSWSLAATVEGRPVMILRSPPSVGVGRRIEIGFVDGKGTLVAQTTECDVNVCLALLPVDARLKARIETAALAMISYDVGGGSSGGSQTRKLLFHAPLADLAAALGAI